MISLGVEEAFEAYEAARHRLPSAAPGARAYRRVRSLEDISELFEVFLLDAFGVLNIGETAIPGVVQRVEDLRAAGKRVLVVSNAASVPASALLQKYHKLGYVFEAQDIVTSRATLAAARQVVDARHWGVMGSGDALSEDLGASHAVSLNDDPEVYASVEGFMLISSASWTETRQVLLERALQANPRPVVVANPDIVAPREQGFSAEPGHFAHRLADRNGLSPQFFGKPFANIFDLAFARVADIEKSRIVMVGDSLHTDVLGAQTAGIASALVTGYGFFADADAERAIRRSGIYPDFLLDRP